MARSTLYVARTIAVVSFLVGVSFLAATAAGEPDVASQIDEMFAEWNRSDAPGAVVAVIHDGRIVYENAFGMADIERGVALTPRSAFEIGSVSKQFTAMCILLLEHDGKLSIDDEVRKYVPELPVYERPITIRHLLHHTSGIRDVETLIPLAGWPYVNYYRVGQLLELVTRQQGLNFPPGDEYLYSNSGYLLLADIVERTSGRSLRDFARERIFGPLGMRHTQFWDSPAQIVENRALAYSPNDDGGYGLAMWNMPFAGPSGLYTTVGDLALWDANFYDNALGGGAALIERMTEPGTLANGESTNYASGLVISTYRDLPMISHGGAWMGFRAGFLRLPDERLSVIQLANAPGIGPSTQAIANLYLDAAAGGEENGSPAGPPPSFEPPPAVELPPERLAELEGTYWNEAQSLLRTIELREGTLYYVRGAGNATELRPVEPGAFVMIGINQRVDVELDAGADGQGRSMTVAVGDEEPLHFEPVAAPSKATLAAYAGDYRSAELERTLRLEVKGEQLQAAWVDDPRPSPARVVSSDRLLVQQFVPVPWFPQDVDLEIERDSSGRVTGLTLSCPMVRGVTFGKKVGG